jgi:histidyl-tRNA synthetase
LDKVCDELTKSGVSDSAIEKIKTYLQLTLQALPTEDILNSLETFFKDIPVGQEGLSELRYLLQQQNDITLDVTLARGLNYYTGTILEIKPVGIQMGSIGGGGRYDDLTGLFGVQNVPGVGISFGVDRIYDVMEELQLFPSSIHHLLDVMIVNFGSPFEQRNKEVLQALRRAGLKSELYPDASKFDKQLKYANKRGVRFVMMIGEDEMRDGIITLKNFITGEQTKASLTDCLSYMQGAS